MEPTPKKLSKTCPIIQEKEYEDAWNNEDHHEYNIVDFGCSLYFKHIRDCIWNFFAATATTAISFASGHLQLI
jgi:hypothetical protein